MKYILTLVFLSMIGGLLTAQNYKTAVLTKHRNLPHRGDSIIKQQVEFVDPGYSGRYAVWNFRSVLPVNNLYNLRYKVVAPDTNRLIGVEHRTLYRYEIHGDTLFHTGFENATTRLTYTKPEIKMHFPFFYGDTIISRFEGWGEYCHRVPLHVSGTTITVGDGSGSLFTPQGLEFKNALRVKSIREYTETGVDSVTMQLVSYAWYVRGNRYPVFETLKTTTLKKGKPGAEHKVASFFYPPVVQLQQTDTTGLAESDVLAEYLSPFDGIVTLTKLLTNPVESQLRIMYELAKDATISFVIHDAAGKAKVQTVSLQQEPGRHTQTISMECFLPGIYPLSLIVNGMVKCWNVVKK